MPSVDFRLHTANLLVKIEDFKKSVKILDSIIQEEDEHIEAWFLLANNLCHLKKFDSSKECLKNIDLLIAKHKINDPELQKALEDIRRKVQKGLSSDSSSAQTSKSKDQKMITDTGKDSGDADDGEWEDADEEGFETYSEEDVSDDDNSGDGASKNNGKNNKENKDDDMMKD